MCAYMSRVTEATFDRSGHVPTVDLNFKGKYLKLLVYA